MYAVVLALPVLGFVIGWGLRGDHESRRRFARLPPATARAIDRARRAGRANLRSVPIFVSPARADFDSGETR